MATLEKLTVDMASLKKDQARHSKYKAHATQEELDPPPSSPSTDSKSPQTGEEYEIAESAAKARGKLLHY